MKLSQLLIVGSLMVGSAIPVLATGRGDYGRHNRSGSEVEVENKAYIDSSASAMSDTGMNSIVDSGSHADLRLSRFGHHNGYNNNPGDNLIDTGNAGSGALSEVFNVNLTDLPALESGRSRGRHSSNGNDLSVDNYARINATADAMSGTGMNSITGRGNNTILTGNADSLSTASVHDVNVTGLGL